MVFQVVVPKQLRDFELGRHRLQFIYQAPSSFAKVIRFENLDRIKTEEGFAKVAGIELTLLDCARYFHKAGGISSVAQVVKDIGDKADSAKLASIAGAYENSSVRRLGFLLERSSHEKQALALEPFARKAKTLTPLNPAVKPLVESLAEVSERSTRWKLLLNEPVETDS